MHSILNSQLSTVALLCENHRVARLYAVGSVLNGNFKATSDLDFLVVFEPMPVLDFGDNYFDLQHKLVALFGRKVDLIIEKDLKNPVLKQEFTRTRQLIYENSLAQMAA